MKLKDKVVLVTGSSSGIGQAIAAALAERGATVIITYHNHQAGAEETLRRVQEFSSGSIVQVDLTDPAQIKAMFAKIASEHGALDVLVNNAGDARPGDFFDNEIWKYQLDNILLSAVHTTQQFLKQNIGADRRKIIMIGSYFGTAFGGSTDYIAYSAAKAALHNLTATLAKIDSSVLVNAIAPGYTWTPAWEGTSDSDKRGCEGETVIKRFILPEEIAQMAVGLLENDAITGQVIAVDGGLSLK